ncbi:SGNH/GDSL hydrolase family protein [Mycoplasma seminis]|uniref:SGNH/GDSL hydrolase family protein n=1 Tax=Mycoplasma seminis TaxID=512749 RepID=A0ABY9H9X6_9MOLU|nr:SGNH/GDSL hydrolase family protein [Mycoplasma seminis]WLP85390.1 SGNH/GDSL hydrolase family protein [Mycoplasma seminis]
MKKSDLLIKALEMLGKVLSDKIEKDRIEIEGNIRQKYNLVIEDNLSNLTKETSANLIKKDEEVYYIALGDSITAGFDGFIDKDYPGQFQDGKVVNGSSLGSYFAEILNKTNKLSYFANYAVSGTSITDWINYLEEDVTKVDPHNIVADALSKEGYTRDEVMQNIAKANLITITIGAMDFFYLVFWYIFNNHTQELLDAIETNTGYEIFYDYVKTGYDEIMSIATSNLQKFVDRIKQFASPNANINIISYPVPFLMLQQALDKHIFKVQQTVLKTNTLENIIGLLNNNLKEISSKSGLNFVSLYNNQYWHQHASELSAIYYDIHPNYRAYKKMAMDLYIKLSTKEVNISNLDIYDFNKIFWTKDYKFYKYQLEPVDNLADIFSETTEGFLDNLNDFDKAMLPKRNYKNYPKRLTQFTGWITASAKNISYNIFETDLYKILDKDKLLLNYINKHTELEKLVNEIMQTGIKSELLSDVLNKLQESLDGLIKSNHTELNDIFKAITHILKNKTLIFKSLYAVLNSSLINYDKAELIKILNIISFNLASYLAPKLISIICNLTIGVAKHLNYDYEQDIIEFKQILTQKPLINFFTDDIPMIVNSIIEEIILNNKDIKSYQGLLNALTSSGSRQQYAKFYTDSSMYALKWIRLWFAQDICYKTSMKLIQYFISKATDKKFSESQIQNLMQDVLAIVLSDDYLLKTLDVINVIIRLVVKNIIKNNNLADFSANLKISLFKNRKVRNYVFFVFRKLKFKNKSTLIKLIFKLM